MGPVEPTLWKRSVTPEALNRLAGMGLMRHLGIVFTEVGPDFLRAEMPVEERVTQPLGLLHGGASCVLAETLASVGGSLAVPEGRTVVGLEINANHVRAVRRGKVCGIARPLHMGQRTQVWEIRITDEAGRLVCASRMTLAVVERPDA